MGVPAHRFTTDAMLTRSASPELMVEHRRAYLWSVQLESWRGGVGQHRIGAGLEDTQAIRSWGSPWVSPESLENTKRSHRRSSNPLDVQVRGGPQFRSRTPNNLIMDTQAIRGRSTQWVSPATSPLTGWVSSRLDRRVLLRSPGFLPSVHSITAGSQFRWTANPEGSYQSCRMEPARHTLLHPSARDLHG